MKLRSLMKCGILSIAGLFLLAAANGYAASKVNVCVSILPQKYFVDRIGGDLVDVDVMVAPGANPHSYEPKPRQMVKLAKTAVYFAIGVNFEDVWLDKIAGVNSRMRIVHTEEGVVKIPMAAHHHEAGSEKTLHESGAEEEHAHHDETRLDPHIWTAPGPVRIQARHIFEALAQVDPLHASEYRSNFDRFVGQIDALDEELRDIFKDRQGFEFMVFHPAWGYLAHEYGLVQVPVALEGKSPKAAQLRHLITHAREHRIKIIFVQPQLSAQSAAIIAKETGAEVVVADPLAYDWAENLRRQAEIFKTALRK